MSKFKSEKSVITDNFKNLARMSKSLDIDPSTFEGWHAWAKVFDETDKEALNFFADVDSGKRKIEDVDNYINNASKSTSKLSSAFKSFGANLAINAGITIAISLITKLVTSYSEMIDKAKEATQTYQEQSSSLESNKQSITELREALDSGNLSYSEATEKRQELMSIQSALVDSYGNEVAGIDLVNGSLETQIDLLDKVDKKNRKALENSVNEYTTGQKIINEASNIFKYMSPMGGFSGVKDLANGENYWDLVKNRFDPYSGVLDYFDSNLDKIIDKVENFEGNFTATGNDYIDNYIESFDNIAKTERHLK